MKKLLITGGSGYVGSRLIEKLLKETDLEIVNYDISLLVIIIFHRVKNLNIIKKILLIQKSLKKL